ncbi:MAG: ScnB-like protein [Gemmataceae bacterium]
MRGIHDLGGVPAGPIDKSEHVYTLWEKRVHAMMDLLNTKGVMNLHELRRGIESLGAEEYDRLGYYEKWITSIAANMQQKGIFTTEELGARLADVERREE